MKQKSITISFGVISNFALSTKKVMGKKIDSASEFHISRRRSASPDRLTFGVYKTFIFENNTNSDINFY